MERSKPRWTRARTSSPLRARFPALTACFAHVTYWLCSQEVHNMPNDHLSSTFAALADPTRRAILARLTSGETSVMELAKPFDMSQPAISKHLRVLERAGLISRGRDAQ